VIAEERAEIVGMYTASLLPVHVDGREEELGYLGGLRVSAAHRRRIRHLREGYASIERLAPSAGTRPWWFSVVASENAPARRLLEANVRDLPRYRALGEYCTFGLPTSRGVRGHAWRRASERDVARVIAFHNANAARFQFAPVLGEASVRAIGIESFFVHEHAGEVRATAALWDQRAWKRIVARRYRAPIGALVPAYNAYARIARRMPLPRTGRALDQTFLAFLAFSDEALYDARPLVRELLSRCTTPVASIGVHAASALVPALASFKPVRYPARVYSVSFGDPPQLAPLPAQPEVAWL
jgi:hypothetical protein